MLVPALVLLFALYPALVVSFGDRRHTESNRVALAIILMAVEVVREPSGITTGGARPSLADVR